MGLILKSLQEHKRWPNNEKMALGELQGQGNVPLADAAIRQKHLFKKSLFSFNQFSGSAPLVLQKAEVGEGNVNLKVLLDTRRLKIF